MLRWLHNLSKIQKTVSLKVALQYVRVTHDNIYTSYLLHPRRDFLRARQKTKRKIKQAVPLCTACKTLVILVTNCGRAGLFSCVQVQFLRGQKHYTTGGVVQQGAVSWWPHSVAVKVGCSLEIQMEELAVSQLQRG